jgi:N-acetyl-beta-hexosaminidase
VVTALSGCGGSDTTAKFKSGYNAVRGPLNQTGQAIAQEISQASKQTDAQVSSNFRSLAVRFQSQVTQLKALTPPSSVAAQWKNVTDAATKLDSDLNAIASAAGAHNASGTQHAAASLAANASALQQAITPIKQKLGLK